MSRHRGRDAPPAPQRARAAPGTHARPRHGPALGRGWRRAGRGRPAGRSREPGSSTDPRAATAAGTLGTECGGRQRSRVRATLGSANFVRVPGGLGAQGGRGWDPRTSAGGRQHAPATGAASPWKLLAFCDAKYST